MRRIEKIQKKLSATEIYLVIRYSYSHLLNAALKCLNQQTNKIVFTCIRCSYIPNKNGISKNMQKGHSFIHGSIAIFKYTFVCLRRISICLVFGSIARMLDAHNTYDKNYMYTVNIWSTPDWMAHTDFGLCMFLG